MNTTRRLIEVIRDGLASLTDDLTFLLDDMGDTDGETPAPNPQPDLGPDPQPTPPIASDSLNERDSVRIMNMGAI